MSTIHSKKNLLKRTAKLEKELATQKHELQIEAALEKVRVVAMGMNKPGDLLVICKTLYEQFLRLGFTEMRNAMVNIHNDEDKSFINYDYSKEIGKSSNHLTYNIHPLVEKQIKKIRSAGDAFSETYFTGKDLTEWKKFRKRIGEKDDPRLNKNNGLYYYFYSIGIGSIGISTFGAISKEKKVLLKRFRNVFQLSYQRYIDIAKAEAQVREAKIEAALERVRASSMAMHRSNELDKVIKEVTEQLTVLDFEFDASNITTDLTSAGLYVWNASPEQPIPSGVYIPYKNIDIINWIYTDWGVHEGVKTDTFNKAQKNAFFKHYFTHTEARNISDERKKYILKATSLHFSFACRKDFALGLVNYHGIIYTEEQNNILARFAKVFEQSYIRFLDLQKAEAQAKEAQIELGLERVRARAIAMEKSDDLSPAVAIVFEEMEKLNLGMLRCGIGIINREKRSVDVWSTAVSSHGRTIQVAGDESMDIHPLLQGAYDAWLVQEDFSYSLRGEDLIKYYNAVALTNIHLPESQANLSGSSSREQFYYMAPFPAGGLYAYSEIQFTEDIKNVTRRFARVFEQTYTRFLDLKRAETQAKEAQIELALERVRARTMAMQKSEELQETTLVLFQQFRSLGATAAQVSICVFDEDTKIGEMFLTLKGEKIDRSFKMDLDKEIFVMKNAKKAFLNSQKNFSFIVKGKELQNYNLWRNSLIGKKGWDESDAVRKQSWYVNGAFFSRGMMGISSNIPVTAEASKLLDRFASVFDLTFTRFLDLQKAEAQAREAQIEAALERVRGRSMAMHNSSELHEVIKVVTEQLSGLGIKFDHANFSKIDAAGDWDLWISTPEQAYPSQIHFPYFDHRVFNQLNDLENTTLNFFSDLYTAEEKNIFFRKFFETTEARNIPEERKQYVLNDKGMARSFFRLTNIWFSMGKYDDRLFTDEENNIFKRFAIVFDQSYTRFLDLQKAEAQAREAQIEAALERVRSHAMAMQTSEELNALIGTVFTELTKLDLVLTRCVILIYEGNEKGVRWWMANSEAPSMPMNFFVRYADLPFFNEYLKGWRERSLKWQYILEGENKFNTDEFLFKETELSQLPDFVIAGMRAPDRVYLNASFNNFGDLTLASLEPLSEEHFNILLRFAKIFDLTYTRFNDLKQAEAQAREAQIQLALERVRARTMAMQKSDELAEVAILLFKQVSDLGIKTWTTGFNIWSDDNNYYEDWITNPQGGFIEPYTVDATRFPVFMEIADARKRGEEFFVQYVEGEMLEQTYRHLSKFGEKQFTQLVESGFQFPSRQFDHFVFGSKISLMFITYEPVPEAHDIFKRFGKVFEQTYTRFLDLQKAEIQAREAQIELALERVRARTMAMQKSDELAEAAQLLYHEFGTLGINTITCGYMFIDEEKNMQTAWTALPDGTLLPDFIDFPLTGDQVLNKRYEDWKQKKPLHIFEIQGEVNKEHHRFLANYVPPFVVKDIFSKLPDKIVFHCANFSDGYLLILATDYFSPDDQQTIIRFAKVFEMTYRRFLDLKQAEAQVRESQIQLALERVRARTMAMHRSVELAETAQVLFHQLQELGAIPDRIAIGIADELAGVVNFWSTDQSGSHIDKSFKARLNERTVMSKTYQAWKDHKSSLVIDLHGDDVKEWVQFAREEMGVVVKDEFIKDRRVHNFAFFSHGWILVTTHEPQAPEAIPILERFASVFSLTYRRFLDLEKAEEQAREAQIEAALERVRARSMAMHHSTELHAAADVLFQQLRIFGGNIMNAGIALCKQDADADEYWLSSDSGIRPVISIPHTEDPIQKKLYEDWKNKSEFFSIAKEGDELRAHYNYMLSVPSLKPFFEEGPDWSYPTWQKWHAAYFSHGYLFMITLEPYEEEKILVRFARVFEQAYTRFLDLKRAEAQASEAQVESALEKVRSRSLAMHKSDELQEVVNTVFERLKELDVEMDSANIAIFKEGTRDYDYWIASPAQKRSAVFHMPYIDPGISKDLMDARETHTDVFLRTYSFEEKNEWFERSFQKTDFKFLDEQRKKFILDAEGITVAIAFAKNTGVQVNRYSSKSLTEDEIDILKRFSKVFEQAYIRFLDLQKAEAQAREAQIETSLERVRSRTMAMHNSNDVGETVAAMFAEFVYLGIHTNRCGILIFNDQHVAEVWTARSTPGGNAKLIIGNLDLDAHKMLRSLYNAWNAKETFYQYDLLDDDLVQYYTAINNSKFYPTQFDLKALPSKEFNSCFFFADGAVFSFTNEPVIEAHSKIMNRFASVFGQTYRRYLDLQKAEAQAREAKIEAALEKVRSRSLAMHKSQEIQEVINEVFIRLRELEINLDSANILIFENGSKDTVCWTGSTASNSTSSLLRYADIDFLKDMISAKEDQLELFTRQYSREQKNEFFNYVYETTALKETPRDRKQFILEAACHTVSVAFSKNIAINLNSYSRESFTESENNIVKRFSKVFEQSYTRFLDLQKAEAQAREAQIEVALERVRAKAMAMHDSDDLNETIKVFYQQISLLSLKPRRCGVGLFNNENRMAEVSVMNTTEQGESIDTIGKMELAGHPVLEAIYENWLSQQDYFPILRGNQIKEYYQLLRPHLNYPDYPHDAVQYGYFFYFKEGALYAWTTEELSEEELKIYRRFNSVLSLTYKRYKDLKQAEKNAREAQIEAGLERVRARTMAMFKSDELAETAVVVFKQMKGLGIIPNRLYIVIINDDSGNMEFWITDENGDKIGSRHVVNVNKNISLKTMYDGWADKKKTIIIDQQGNELHDWLSYWKENFGVSFKDDTTIKRRVQTIAYFSRGFIAIASPGDEPRSTINLLERFAAVFNLTYTRFNDLQIAEAQAMEAQIEAGLERVRARTMAMHNSEDVSAATATMFTELEKLGVENLRCGITIIHKNKTQEVWSVSNIMSDVNGNSVEKKNVLAAGTFDMNAHPLWQLIYEKWNNKEDFIQYYLAGKDKEDYFKVLNTTKDYLPQAIQQFPDTNFQVYLFGEGAVWSVSLQPHSEEHKQIMKRFTSVFSLTFRRYQDLKKAEAQAREATIEAALEKVRGKAMAMHNSNDLSVTASMVFTELRKLGISPIRCGVGLLNKESRKAQLYSATSSADGDGLSLVGWVILSKHPVLEKIYESWLDNEEYYPELQGEQMRSYYQLLLQGLPVATPKIEDDKKQYGHFLPFSVGCLYAWSEAPYNETEIKILKRFATIIDLTFRRYMELQTSEANAREAVKQAALDRIRADIASMRTVADLDRITPLIWNELTILGIPFIRCGVFIMDESQKLIHTFLSTPDGKAIGAFHLPYDTPGSFSVMLKHWLDKKVYISQWGEVDFIAIAEILLQQGSIVSKEQYLNSLPKGGFYLHFLPFLQGMLYVGNTTQLGEEEIELIQHVSDAFSTAYARYEDFNKLEAAKQQVEKTLTDLKQAQTQLVQSEKMASLGELTAGIAHEIQNPLNFVNNFSEVSNELLEEMKIELEKGNNEDALAIARDVKQNLEKINHHGKRADGIVKGMLQHSRTSSGQKELTDINALCDEYLRLSYHGLRAKEKSFNADFKTEFDAAVGRIDIVPQDIGRVILNLINNAFYAVKEKGKLQAAGYKPQVIVRTRKLGDNVEIKVEDNGNGIPKSIVDKIFQPFFTTKPTGQGTGLGLSLAYDIIKAHGGEIKVATKDGGGSEFIVQLPVV